MTRRLNLVLSLAAGLVGGVCSRYLSPDAVRAQARTAPPQEVSAQKFVLVNSEGATSGVFGLGKNGSPEITLFDAQGHVIWSTTLRAETIRH